MEDSGPIGRDAEIAEIHYFFAAAAGRPAALAITGDTGIGKTMVWKHVVQAASCSSTVLSCQPNPVEMPLAFSALEDLFGDIAPEVLPALPAPRRRAVEVALFEEASPGQVPTVSPAADRQRPDQRLLARGILDVIRVLSRDSPLVLAVDDAQLLDYPSTSVLEFCFRRLGSEPVSILLTLRGGGAASPLGLGDALPHGCLRYMQLGPLSLGAIGEILRSQLGVVFPRYTLTRLYDACGGNPFYALESAQALTSHPRMAFTQEPISIPETLTDLVWHRVSRLTPDAREVGRLVAASSVPRERVIRVAYGDGESWTAIDKAIDQRVIERDGDTLRFTHPLLRSVLYTEMTSDERRGVHLRLGIATHDLEERAWHFALGADRPSEEIAMLLDSAAKHAASRGALQAAAALEEHATRLAPVSQLESARERMIGAADYHFRSGDITRSRELIEVMLSECPAGQLHASLLLRLATIHYHQNGWPLAEQTLHQAALEARENPALRTQAEQELAFARLVAGDLTGACRWANTSLRSADQAADPHLIAQSMARIALFEFLQGNRAWPDMLKKAEAATTSDGGKPVGRLLMLDPCLVAGLILKWCDRLDEARVKLANRYRHALDCGDEACLPYLLYHFSQLECWAGNWETAEEYALEGCRVAEESHQQSMRPATMYSLALIRAHQGQIMQARELAGEALALCDHTGNVPVASQVISVLGFAALSMDDHQAAHSHLSSLADATVAIGLGEPSVVKFLPDEIEALAALGELDRAWSFTRQLEARGRLLGRRWALAAGARCRARLAAIDGDIEGAETACQQALAQHEQLSMPFELGRTLLIAGTIERRAKRKAAARDSLNHALVIFERLGAPLWAGKARRELTKIATHPSVNRLTATEHRIAALIAQGRTNREVASAMFVTENTVQTHLRHIFQKLGVKSRTELAAWFLSASASTAIEARPAAGSDLQGS